MKPWRLCDELGTIPSSCGLVSFIDKRGQVVADLRRSLWTLHLFVCLFAASAVFGLIPAYDPRRSLPALIAIFCSALLYFFLVRLVPSRRALEIGSALFLGVATVLALYVVGQYYYLDYGKGSIIPELGRATTFLPDFQLPALHPNAVATFLEAAAPLGVGLALYLRRKWAGAFAGTSTAIILYAVFLTASRGSWLSLAVAAAGAAVLGFPKSSSRRRSSMLVGLGVTAASILLLTVILLGPERLPIFASTFARAWDRISLFRNSLYLAGDYLFTGVGLGDAFPMVYSKYGLLIHVPYLTYPHNLPLSVLLNQGVFGLIASAGIVIAFVLMVRAACRLGTAGSLFHGAWLGVLASLLHGFTDASQYAPGSYWTMPATFLVLGIAAGLARLMVPPASLPSPARRSRNVAFPGLAALLMVLALGLVFTPRGVAAWHTNQGALQETRADLSPDMTDAERGTLRVAAEAEYRRAVEVDHSYSNPRRRLGNLLVETERYEEAIPLLESAFEREEDNPAAVKGLGLAYAWVGRVEEAARLLLKLGPPSDPVSMATELRYWSWYHLEHREPLLAAYSLETAFLMWPGRTIPRDWIQIAEAYAAAGREEKASLWYQHVVDVQPDNQQILGPPES